MEPQSKQQSPASPNRSRSNWIRLAVGLFLLAGWCVASAAPTTPPFRVALETHLAAIIARDIDALLPTLTTGESLTMIGPNGRRWETRQQYVDFHRAWFAAVKDDDSRYQSEIVQLVESPALSHALIRYSYTSKDRDGKAATSVAWLTLTFALENGGWRLVFDQNTAIGSS